MTTKTLPPQYVIEEGIDVLFKELGPSKASEFWNYIRYSNKDYAKLRQQLFKDVSMAQIVEEMQSRKREYNK